LHISKLWGVSICASQQYVKSIDAEQRLDVVANGRASGSREPRGRRRATVEHAGQQFALS
jgi:hypothetical protein